MLTRMWDNWAFVYLFGNVKLCCCYWKVMAVFQKIKNTVIVWPSNSISGLYGKELERDI